MIEVINFLKDEMIFAAIFESGIEDDKREFEEVMHNLILDIKELPNDKMPKGMNKAAFIRELRKQAKKIFDISKQVAEKYDLLAYEGLMRVVKKKLGWFKE